MFVDDKKPYTLGVWDRQKKREGWFTVHAEDESEARRIGEYQLKNGLTKVNWYAPDLEVTTVKRQ